MLDRSFFDTNIFLYAFLQPKNEVDVVKSNIALGLLENLETSIFISSQVINEVANTLLRKSNLTSPEIINRLELMVKVTAVLPLTPAMSFDAVELQERYQFSFYDCLILSAALSGSCRCVVTEDLQDGQVIYFKSKQVNIVNPFATGDSL
jgi:predicted nucleic acid-binding protein